MDKNSTNRLVALTKHKKGPNTKIGYIFIFLIVSLFYVTPLLASAAAADASKYTDYLYLYTSLSYFLIVLSILIFHRIGLDVFRDHFSLWLIVGGCLLAAALGDKQATVYKFFLVMVGVILALYNIVNRKNLKTPNIKSIFVGLLWSVVTTVSISLLLFFLGSIHESFPPNLLAYLLDTLLYQISFITVIEEACFRGLLFGFLLMNGYDEDKALIIQAILFWGSHYLQISNLSLFFIAIPLLTLSLTVLVKRYKMLYMSVMVHTIANVLGPVLVVILNYTR